MSKIARGDFVIVDEWDRPHVNLIAEVEDVLGDNIFYCRYITDYPSRNGCQVSNPTLVADFGVDLKFEESTVTAIASRDSVATYTDGKPRPWQGGLSQSAKLRPWFKGGAICLDDIDHVVNEIKVFVDKLNLEGMEPTLILTVPDRDSVTNAYATIMQEMNGAMLSFGLPKFEGNAVSISYRDVVIKIKYDKSR
jgi:hypothetical protein